MLRTTFTLILSLALAGFGVFLLVLAASNPQHASDIHRLTLAGLGAVQVVGGLVGLYLAAVANPLWKTWQSSRPTADIRKLKAPAPARSVFTMPGHDSAEAAAQAAIDARLAEPEGAGRARLSDAYPSFFIGLDQLSAYSPELDPALVFQGGLRTVFPVSVDGAIATGVTVTREKDGSWRFAELGFAPLAKSLAQARTEVEAKFAGADSYMLVALPAMAHFFLGFRSEGKLYFTCLSDWSSSPVKAGETLPASEALSRLQPLASEKKKRYDEADGDMLGD